MVRCFFKSASSTARPHTSHYSETDYSAVEIGPEINPEESKATMVRLGKMHLNKHSTLLNKMFLFYER